MAEASTNLKSLTPPVELQRAPVVENNQGLGWLTDPPEALPAPLLHMLAGWLEEDRQRQRSELDARIGEGAGQRVEEAAQPVAAGLPRSSRAAQSAERSWGR